jgi:hypothetical protein
MVGTLRVLESRPNRVEGCHSIAQLIMSDLQTSESMGDDILRMIVCLRDGKS